MNDYVRTYECIEALLDNAFMECGHLEIIPMSRGSNGVLNGYYAGIRCGNDANYTIESDIFPTPYQAIVALAKKLA